MRIRQPDVQTNSLTRTYIKYKTAAVSGRWPDTAAVFCSLAEFDRRFRRGLKCLPLCFSSYNLNFRNIFAQQVLYMLHLCFIRRSDRSHRIAPTETVIFSFAQRVIRKKMHSRNRKL